jgi:branched-chain amino acid transport system permease protein
MRFNRHARPTTVWGFLAGLLLGAVLAALVGFLGRIAHPALKGDYLAIATLGMSEIIRIIFTNLDITNGAAGLSGIPRFTNWTFYIFLWLELFC